MRARSFILCAALAAATASAQPAQKTPLKADDVVKNPVGVELIRPLPNQAICQAVIPAAYGGAVASATAFCARWYTCPAAFPIYYAPTKGLAACTCTVIPPGVPNAGNWQALCDLGWNGICGCASPPGNLDAITLAVELTPLERDRLNELFPNLAANLTSMLQPLSRGERERVLTGYVDLFRSYDRGQSFHATLRSDGNAFTIEITAAPQHAAQVAGTVATLAIRDDGRASITPRGELPGGVSRALGSMFASTIGAAPPAR